VDGPYGEFNYRTGSARQLWIAAGIGITPFLSWIRDFERQPLDREVDFFYTTNVPEEALFLDEIEKASRQQGFRAHVSHSARDGRLSVARVIAASGEVADRDIYMLTIGWWSFRNAFQKWCAERPGFTTRIQPVANCCRGGRGAAWPLILAVLHHRQQINILYLSLG
jgi:predicted ferric reductase